MLLSWKQPTLFEPHCDKTNKMAFAQGRLRSAWASAQSDQSSPSTRRKLGSLVTLSVQIERRIWSDWANAKADLSLRWAYVFCWFCHDAAHFNTQICKYTNTFLENGIGSLAVLSLSRRVIPISLHVLSKEPIHYHTCKNRCCPSLSKAVSASIYRQ